MTHSNVKWLRLATASVLFLVFVATFLPTLAGAQETPPKQKFTPLVEFPGVTDRGANIEEYINGLYTLAITAASLLVVVKLIGAGAGYVMSDVVTSKEQSKKDIRNALIGLLIILAAVTILNEINPNLTRLNFLSGVEGLDITGSNVILGPYERKPGDQIHGCGEMDQQSCQKNICEPKGGQVTTSGIKYANGRVQYTGRPLCVVKANGEPGTQPGDTQLPGGVTINDNIEYTDDKVNEIIRSQVEAENYISHTSVNNITKDQEIRTCTEVQGGTPHIINKKPPAEDVLLCLKRSGSADNSEDSAGPDDVDLEGTYTINDPAIPSKDISQGPDHGKSVKLLEFRTNGYQVQFQDGSVTLIGCTYFDPKPPKC